MLFLHLSLEIAVAGKDQAIGIKEINKALAELDQVGQQNSAVSEESAAASEELLSQSRLMEESVAELVRMVVGAAKAAAPRSDGMRTGGSSGHSIRSARAKVNGAAKSPASAAASGAQQPKPNEVIPLDSEDYAGF